MATPFAKEDIDFVVNAIWANEDAAPFTDAHYEVLEFLIGDLKKVLCAHEDNLLATVFTFVQYICPQEFYVVRVLAVQTNVVPYCRWQVHFSLNPDMVNLLTVKQIRDKLLIQPTNAIIIKNSFALLPTSEGLLYKLEYGVLQSTCFCQRFFKKEKTQLTSSVPKKVSEDVLLRFITKYLASKGLNVKNETSFYVKCKDPNCNKLHRSPFFGKIPYCTRKIHIPGKGVI